MGPSSSHLSYAAEPLPASLTTRRDGGGMMSEIALSSCPPPVS
jgi:hypothetical protein